MCGIFCYFIKNGFISKNTMKLLMINYEKIENRGPDRHTLSFNKDCLLGFHRLAINDLSDKGDQPFDYKEDMLMCNGEIYNYHELKEREGFDLISKSDCEIIIHLFQKYGVEQGVKMIDGVFAIVYITKNSIYLIRDKIGVKPLFYADDWSTICIASEPVAIDNIGYHKIIEVLPATIMHYSKDSCDFKEIINFYNYPKTPLYMTDELSIYNTHYLLDNAVSKRLCSDRPIGCLLSGGLDSSIIAAILAKKIGSKLKTFSVGFPDSTDIIYARKVAKYINSDHHEYIIQYKDALKYIQTVIKKLATFDTTTIRASTPMFMLCEWINKNFKEKVIFSGEGSDEIFCGYLYFHNAPTDNDAFNDSIRLVQQLYKYDVLRADRCTAENSLEFREPFLDQDVVNLALHMSGEIKKPRKTSENIIFEKYILRKAFEGYLPDDVLWRRKAAFSDAVSSSEKPWYKWIHEHIENLDVYNFGGTKESNYYKTIFYQNYRDYMPEIPLWLPQWSNVGDEPSATVLPIYNKNEH